MDCHDVRLLMALGRRGGETNDPTERAAIQQHLDACPDCTALHRSEQVVDAALGTAMRAVVVPPSHKARLLTRLAAQRPRRWPSVAAAAAALLLMAGGVTTWTLWPLPRVDSSLAEQVINGRPCQPHDEVEQWFKDKGVEMATWRQLDHQHLWSYDVIDFQGRRVPKLVFFNPDRNAVAEVIVLRTSQFDTRDLSGGFPGQTPNRIFVEPREDHPEYVYLIGTNEQSLDAFLSKAH